MFSFFDDIFLSPLSSISFDVSSKHILVVLFLKLSSIFLVMIEFSSHIWVRALDPQAEGWVFETQPRQT